MDLGDLAAKLAFVRMETREVDGHNEEQLDAALNDLAKHRPAKPRALVARTVKGQGVSFMADDNRWHYTRLTPETYDRAMAELTN